MFSRVWGFLVVVVSLVGFHDIVVTAKTVEGFSHIITGTSSEDDPVLAVPVRENGFVRLQPLSILASPR